MHCCRRVCSGCTRSVRARRAICSARFATEEVKPGVYVCRRGTDAIRIVVAAHGYAVLNLGYFKYADLPKELVNIPLESFEEGLKWLEKQECVAAGRLAVWGPSRGGELAL